MVRSLFVKNAVGISFSKNSFESFVGRVDGGCGGEDGEEQKRNRFPMQMFFLRPKNMNESGASSIETARGGLAERHLCAARTSP